MNAAAIPAGAALPVLISDRLRLRPIQREDAEPAAALLQGDSAAIRMTERIPDPCTVEDVRIWIERLMSTRERAWAVTRRADGVFLGCVGVVLAERGALSEAEAQAHAQADCVLGYWIGRAFWGQGFATEAGRAVLTCLCDFGMRGVEAEVLIENPASRRVLEKLGFHKLGNLERHNPARGGLRRLERFRLVLAAPVSDRPDGRRRNEPEQAYRRA